MLSAYSDSGHRRAGKQAVASSRLMKFALEAT
jgi:hypothetical protein